jgi:hypothetical protein
MNTDVLSAGMQTFLVCALIELAIWAAFLVGTGSSVAAMFYALAVGPVSLFIAPIIYKRLASSRR